MIHASIHDHFTLPDDCIRWWSLSTEKWRALHFSSSSMRKFSLFSHFSTVFDEYCWYGNLSSLISYCYLFLYQWYTTHFHLESFHSLFLTSFFHYISIPFTCCLSSFSDYLWYQPLYSFIISSFIFSHRIPHFSSFHQSPIHKKKTECGSPFKLVLQIANGSTSRTDHSDCLVLWIIAIRFLFRTTLCLSRNL